MPANQNPLNRIDIFWNQFTPRKLLYHVVSVNFVKFGPHGLSVFFFFFFFFLGGTLYSLKPSMFFDVDNIFAKAIIRLELGYERRKLKKENNKM